jgi:hypothetical protein
LIVLPFPNTNKEIKEERIKKMLMEAMAAHELLAKQILKFIFFKMSILLS